MRRLTILTVSALTAATVGACAYDGGPPEPRSPQALQQLDRLLAGKVAGRPQTCLPNYRARDMTVIDENTVLFRDGATTWRAELPGGCMNLGRPGYALVTNQYGGEGLCSGQINRVVDTSTGILAGSCTFAEFTPYSPPPRR